MNSVTSHSSSRCRSSGWLDTVAIGISVTCAVHCLLTPVLIIALPVLATTVWVQQNFHLWMLLLVLPTSGAAVFLGCRKHKDKAVLVLSILGLGLLSFVAVGETIAFSDQPLAAGAACPRCSGEECAETEGAAPLTSGIMLNLIGAMLLSSAHVRNFILCRKARCNHGDEREAGETECHSK